MELLGWAQRLDRAALRRALATTTRAYPAPDAFVRFDVLAGPPRALGTEERTLLALAPLAPVPEAILARGAAVRVSALRRARPLIKVASFVLERRPYPLGSPEAYEHLILDASGRILEGTSSNFSALRGGVLQVAGDEALRGVTQGVVCALAGELGLRVEREPVRLAELADVDEAFLTGSTRGIVPVVEVEGQRIGSGVPGPWTARLVSAYREHVARQARPALEPGAVRARK
jgi:branched-subunit amino acid aminotransferase/4-amino-4-deoxychorismate lyase